MTSIAPLLFVTVLAAIAGAPPVASAAEANCGDANTTFEMQKCADASFRAADARLNDVRKQLDRYLDDQDRMAFADAHAKWLAYREANCKSQSLLYSGGSLEAVALVNCRAAMTEERFKELDSLHKYYSEILVPRDSR